MFTTPQRITADVRRLCRRINGLDEPLYVEVSARRDCAGDDCFIDVRRQVEEHGGTIQHGWTVWEWPGIVIQGEFHAVWRKPDGHLLDVSFKKDGETRILFAPDPKRVFNERRIDNVRMALSNDRRVKEWIDLKERYHRLAARLLKDVPFGREIDMPEEGQKLRRESDRLERELIQSRDCRRAVAGWDFPVP